jgi:hypothetical protein
MGMGQLPASYFNGGRLPYRTGTGEVSGRVQELDEELHNRIEED